MARCKRLAIAAILLVAGCTYNSRERVDQSVSALTCHPYDQQPPAPTENQPATPPAEPILPLMPLRTTGLPYSHDKEWTCKPLLGWRRHSRPHNHRLGKRRLDLNIPPEIPGAEARRLELPKEPVAKQREIERVFPALPPLAAAPNPVPGPNGQPYTLADLQQIAAVNSPQLRQAASDVEAARGNMIQANAYPNPTVSYQMQPSNNGSTPGADGFGVDQTIKTGGKLACKPPPPRWICTMPSWPCGGLEAIWPPKCATPISPSSWPRRQFG